MAIDYELSFLIHKKFLDEDIKKVISKLTPDESKHVSRELSRFVREMTGEMLNIILWSKTWI